MAETRKLAAILAADVAGYSKLAGADEERTLARAGEPPIALASEIGERCACVGSLIRARLLQQIYLEGTEYGRQI
jgi:hypothetical protein